MPTPLILNRVLQALRDRFFRPPQHSFTDEQIGQRALAIWQERTAKGLSGTAEDDWQQAIAALEAEEQQEWQEWEIREKARQLWEARQLKLRESDKLTAIDDWRDAEAWLQESRWTRFVQWMGVREKKGWDFVQLVASISIPVALFAGGTLFTYWNNQQQQRIADERRIQDQTLAEYRQQDEVLKNYFDSMRGLLLDKDYSLKDRQKGKDARLVARTLTVTALSQLNSRQDDQAVAVANCKQEHSKLQTATF